MSDLKWGELSVGGSRSSALPPSLDENLASMMSIGMMMEKTLVESSD